MIKYLVYNNKLINFGAGTIVFDSDTPGPGPGPGPEPSGDYAILNIFKYCYSSSLSANTYPIFYVYTPDEDIELNEYVTYSFRDKTPNAQSEINNKHCCTVDDIVEMDTEIPTENTTFTTLMSYKNSKMYDNNTKGFVDLDDNNIRCYGVPTTIEGFETKNPIYKYTTRLNEGTITLQAGRHYLLGITVTSFNSNESPDWDILGITENGTYTYFSCNTHNSSGGVPVWTNPKVSEDSSTNIRPLFEFKLVN